MDDWKRLFGYVVGSFFLVVSCTGIVSCGLMLTNVIKNNYGTYLMGSIIMYSLCELASDCYLIYGIRKNRERLIFVFLLWRVLNLVVLIAETIWQVLIGYVITNSLFLCLVMPGLTYIIYLLYLDIKAENSEEYPYL